MMRRFNIFFLLSIFFIVGCGDPSASGQEALLETGSSVTVNANLFMDENGELPFMTPTGTPVRVGTDEVIGKPYYVAVFEAGFAPGFDPPRHYEWGYFGEDMSVSWTSPSDLEDGPYDVAFVLYRITEVPEDTFGAEQAVVADNGDLATFTLSTDDIRENDPPLTAGFLRVNIEGGDVVKTAENRWVDDLSNISAAALTFNDTVLLVP